MIPMVKSKFSWLSTEKLGDAAAVVIIPVSKAAGPQASVGVSFIHPVWEGLAGPGDKDGSSSKQ